ncbi:pertactin-like passenger domain-containing protein, partial [Cedecea sp.]|uniref:pertactin-like passenger domain-containing protein n=1 Tax=Cedecea sp. TaxID=1970739 RepID=UPI002F3EA376
MDIKFYNQGSQGHFLFNPIKRVFQQAGILGLGAVCFLQPVLAANLGSQQGNAIKVNNGDRIIADTTDANGILYGVLNPDFNTGTVDLGNDVTVTAAAPTGNAQGVLILGDESKLTANRLTVNAESERAVGLVLSGDKAQADLGSGSQIKVTGTGEANSGRATGIQLHAGSTLRADRLSIETQGENGIGLRIDDYGSQANLGSGSTIKTNGRISFGVYVGGLNGNSAYGPAVFTADRLTIDTQGNSAYGMNIQENSIVDLGQGSQITTDGEYAFGIWSFGDVNADALTVFTRGKGSHGIEILDGTARIGAGSHVSSESAGALVANTESLGAGNPVTNVTLNYFGTQDNRNSLFSGGAWGALARGKDANINLKNTDITVDSQGELSTALWAQSSAMITGENIAINGAQGTRGIYAETGSQVDLTGTLAIAMADARQTAIATEHSEGSAASRINASGKMAINGGIESKGGLINIDMASGSVWTGNAFSDNVNGGALNLSMNDSRWNLVSASNLDNLALNNSTVDFSSAALTDDYYTLQVGTLSGAGTFVLRTDIVGEGNGVNNAGDKLVVTGASSGNHLLTVLNRGDLNTTGHEVLTVVETADGKARGTLFTAT